MKLAQVIERYVALKRATGARFKTTAVLLHTFGRTAGPIDIADVDEEMVLAFLNRSQPIRSSWHLKHYTLAGLFRFAMERGLASRSPMPQQLPKRPPYARPYIYSTDELRRLLQATTVLDVRDRGCGPRAMPALTFRTLILLLYGAGLRISEAVALTVDDVDLSANLLVVREAKFFKTRLVPVGPKLASTLNHYAEQRLRLIDGPPSGNAFFLGRHGRATSRHVAEHYFRVVREHAGIERHDGAYFQPRLHDLRHAFAVHRLVAWYREGRDVQLLLPKLSTYLGHIGLEETQHYLTMTPDLLREAGQRFERYATRGVQP